MATSTIRNLTPPQVRMLRTCLEHPDGTAMAKGFNHGMHSDATAMALARRGYVRFLMHRSGGYIYQITDAGRVAAQGLET